MTRWRLTLRNLGRDPWGALLLGLSAAAAVGALTFFIALGSGLTRSLRSVFPEVDRTVEVVAPRVLFQGPLGLKLDDAQLERLRALPGVAEAIPKMMLRVPSYAVYQGNFFGTDLNMGVEIAAEGVEGALLADALPKGEAFVYRAGEPVPVCISEKLLSIYNLTFAPARGLPPLSAALVTGFRLPLTIGQSLVTRGVGRAEVLQARVACISPRVLLAGLTLPLSIVRDLNRGHGQDADSYSAVTLVADRPDAVPALVAEVVRRGFAVDDGEQKEAQLVGGAVAVVTGALSLLSLLIAALACGSAGHALALSVRARKSEIGLLRALGATPADVARLVMGEAALLGVLGGAVGLLAALGAATAVDALALRWLPPLPFKIESFFAFSPALCLAGVGLGLLAGVFGAYAPARAAANVDPARALSGV